MPGPEGVIIGGWYYVVAAYTITGLVLLGYGLTLLRRLRRSEASED